jgi:hypothetical protein
MSAPFLEQQINITFYGKSGKNASDTCALLSKAHGGETTNRSKYKIIGIDGSKTAQISKLYVKIMLITSLNINSMVHFEFTPQGQTVNQAYYVETVKWLHAAVHRKRS